MLGFTVSAKSQKNQVERPMKGTFYAQVIATNGAVEKLSINGNATHIGNFTGTMYFDKSNIDIVPPFINDVIIYGTIVAANGDEIEFGPNDPGMKLTGPGVGTMSGLITLKPGTGRFTNCNGVITTTGHFDMNNDYAMWTANGTIIY
jgi:hypothetical protein